MGAAAVLQAAQVGADVQGMAQQVVMGSWQIDLVSLAGSQAAQCSKGIDTKSSLSFGVAGGEMLLPRPRSGGASCAALLSTRDVRSGYKDLGRTKSSILAPP
nr:unnamed protein product [Digitaria exilis]